MKHSTENIHSAPETMIKHSTKALKSIPRTLIACLYMKYRESIRPDGKIHDPRYEEIISKIDYDFSRLDVSDDNSLFTACRSLLFDQVTRAHIEKNPESVIVSFGSGLDFRFDRIDNGHIQWFDIDLPEVIELRKKIFQETFRVQSIAASVLDHSWADFLPPDKRIFFLAEGLFMYLSPEQVREVFVYLLEHFPGSMLLLEVYTSWFIESTKQSQISSIKKMSDMWKWSSDGWYDIENWDPRIKVIDEWMPINLYGDRMPSLVKFLSDPDFPDFIKEQIIGQCKIGLIQLGL